MHANRIPTRRQSFRPALLAALFPLLLAACGGSDDGGDSAVQPLVITESNAQAVAADALQATNPAAASSIGAMLGLVPRQPMVMMGVEIDETRLCIYGGKLYVGGTVASTSAVTVGDKVKLTAQGCRMDPIYTINGSLAMSILAGGLTSEMAYPYSVTAQVEALNLTLDQSGYVQALAGDTRVEAGAQSETSESVVMSGASLRYSTSTSSYTLQNYLQSVASADGRVTAATTATVITSTPMEGPPVTYQVSTPVPMVTDLAGNFLSGSLKVVSGKVVLLATVTSFNVITVQTDTNGDGTFDQSQTSTVAGLQSLL